MSEAVFSAEFLAAWLRVTTPLLFPALGALISDRAGVINISLEGTMLVAGFTGVVVSALLPGGVWLGVLAGVAVGVLLAAVLAIFHLELGGDIILTAIGLNIFGAALTVVLMFELTGERGTTASLASGQLPFVALPTALQTIPLIGDPLYTALNGQNSLTWFGVEAVIAVGLLLYRTPFGLHLRAVGENPDAAATAGINVRRVRYLALLLSGGLAALGGIYLSMGYLSFFQRDMTAGRGFIALVAPLLGGGTPVGTALAAAVFGLFDALAIRTGTLPLPSQLPQMTPYVGTLLVLVIYTLRARLLLAVRGLVVLGTTLAPRRVMWLGTLHILLAVSASVAVMLSALLLAAPRGFGAVGTVYPLAGLLGGAGLLLIAANTPFIMQPIHIARRRWLSTGVVVVSVMIFGALVCVPLR